MAAARQPQTFNNFLRAVRSCKPNTYTSLRAPPSSRSNLHTTVRRAQTTYPNRYGPAATEGLPPPPKPAGSLAPKKEDVKPTETQQAQTNQSPQTSSKQQDPATTPESKEALQEKQQQQQAKETKAAEMEEVEEEDEDTAMDEGASPLEQASAALQSTKVQSSQPEGVPPEIDPEKPLGNKELEIILSVPEPSEAQNQRSRHPHLEPSPYEHHFDTYSLVQDLANDHETFSEKQAITVMKAVRQMLSINLDLAKEGLVSKSDIENESYLFRAACSELRTTLSTGRASENQRQRTQRALLQHEMDLLNQKVSQDMQNMREELKGMFNDRKMGLQEEKRKIDSQISELNYEITVMLNSEAKSEVEGLRWVLTRRAALAIGAAAFMTLSALQYYSVKSREYAEIEKKRKAALKAQEEKIASENQARYTTPSRSSGTQTEYEVSLG